MAEMTLDQQRAIAMGNARARAAAATATPAAPAAPAPPTAYQQARPYIGMAVETAGMLGGGMLGGAAGAAAGGVGALPGAAAGSGLGYAGARKGLELLDYYVGGQPLPELKQNALGTATDVVTGAAMEAGGQAIAPVLAKLWHTATTPYAKRKAAEIVKDALGTDINGALMMMRNAAGQDIHAGQATATATLPTWQALVQRSLGRDTGGFLPKMLERQGEASVNALAGPAGGITAAEMRGTANAAHRATNNALIPRLETEIAAANTAGQTLPKLEADAAAMREAAARAGDTVRRMETAKVAAEEASKTWRPSTMQGDFKEPWSTTYAPTNLPKPLRKFTYPGELGVRAEQVQAQAADDSLLFGEAARFKESAAASLEAYGLKPLKTESITGRIQQMLKDPKIGPDPQTAGALQQVMANIEKWTNANGVIDAWALDTIRKKSINSVVTQLLGTASRKEQRSLAAAITSKLNPLIREAIEGAGGTGYGTYLDDYSKAMHAIAEQKLSGKALEMFRTSPDKFVRLVEGNDLKTVEKMFGPGQYDIAREVSDDTMATLREQAAIALRDKAVAKQAGEGMDALREVLTQEMTRFRFPSYLSVIASTTNKALDMIEKRLGRKTMDALTQAMKSPEGAVNLMDALPPAERAKVAQIFDDPSLWKTSGKAVVVTSTIVGKNAMAPEAENRNALAR